MIPPGVILECVHNVRSAESAVLGWWKRWDRNRAWIVPEFTGHTARAAELSAGLSSHEKVSQDSNFGFVCSNSNKKTVRDTLTQTPNETNFHTRNDNTTTTAAAWARRRFESARRRRRRRSIPTSPASRSVVLGEGRRSSKEDEGGRGAKRTRRLEIGASEAEELVSGYRWGRRCEDCCQMTVDREPKSRKRVAHLMVFMRSGRNGRRFDRWVR